MVQISQTCTARGGNCGRVCVGIERAIAKHCNFGDFLNNALRDRLVCGLNKESIQRRLLAEADLTFQKACEIAQAMEMVEKDASALNSEATKGINPIQSSQRAQAGETTPIRLTLRSTKGNNQNRLVTIVVEHMHQ